MGRGHIKRQIIILFGLFVLGQLNLVAQEKNDLIQGQEASSSKESVDETTLLLEGDSTGQESDAPSLGVFDFFRVFGILIALIVCIYLFIGLLKKISPISEKSDSSIKILSTKQLKPDKTLHLIEVGEEIFLIGCGQSISLISQIKDKKTMDTLRLNESVEEKGRGESFKNILKDGLSSGGKSLKKPLNVQTQVNRLKKLQKDDFS